MPGTNKYWVKIFKEQQIQGITIIYMILFHFEISYPLLTFFD